MNYKLGRIAVLRLCAFFLSGAFLITFLSGAAFAASSVSSLRIAGPAEVKVGKTVFFPYVVTPSDGAYEVMQGPEIQKGGEYAEIVKSQNNGVYVKGLKEGTFSLWVKLKSTVVPQNAFSARTDPNVVADVSDIKITAMSIAGPASLNVGETGSFSFNVTPPDVKVEWSDYKIYTDPAALLEKTSSGGAFKANAAGTFLIDVTVQAVNNPAAKATATYRCDIKQVQTTLAINRLELDMTALETFTLLASPAPKAAADYDITYASSNAAAASVSAAGVITAVSAGAADITVTAKDKASGAAAAEVCTVRVHQAVIPVTGLSLNRASLLINSGDIFTFVPSIFPLDATNREVKWSSSNSAVVSIDQIEGFMGRMSALNTGLVVITGSTPDNKFSVTCQVQVVNVVPAVTVTGVIISEDAIILPVGANWDIYASVLPVNATNKNVAWHSYNENVAAVTQEGVITGVGEGETFVTATAADGGKTDSVKVTVEAPTPAVISADAVTFLPVAASSMDINAELQLIASVTPSNATDKSVTWSSSAPLIASVNQSGTVKGLLPGAAVITAAASSGKTVTFTVTINASNNVAKIPVTGLTLNQVHIAMKIGEFYQLIPMINPVNATNPNGIFESNNSTVATISSVGRVRALAPGSTVITAKTEDGGFVANCTVEVMSEDVVSPDNGGALVVNKPPASPPVIPEAERSIVLPVSRWYQLNPRGYEGIVLLWKSSDESVVAVSSRGRIAGLKTGAAKITAENEGLKVKLEYDITIVLPSEFIPAASIIIGTPEKPEGEIDYPRIFEAKAQMRYLLRSYMLSPENATPQPIFWWSSDPSIADVDNYGYMTTKRAGQVKITAFIGTNSNVFDELNVTIEESPTPVVHTTSSSGCSNFGAAGVLLAMLIGAVHLLLQVKN